MTDNPLICVEAQNGSVLIDRNLILPNDEFAPQGNTVFLPYNISSVKRYFECIMGLKETLKLSASYLTETFNDEASLQDFIEIVDHFDDPQVCTAIGKLLASLEDGRIPQNGLNHLHALARFVKFFRLRNSIIDAINENRYDDISTMPHCDLEPEQINRILHNERQIEGEFVCSSMEEVNEAIRLRRAVYTSKCHLEPSFELESILGRWSKLDDKVLEKIKEDKNWNVTQHGVRWDKNQNLRQDKVSDEYLRSVYQIIIFWESEKLETRWRCGIISLTMALWLHEVAELECRVWPTDLFDHGRLRHIISILRAVIAGEIFQSRPNLQNAWKLTYLRRYVALQRLLDDGSLGQISDEELQTLLSTARDERQRWLTLNDGKTRKTISILRTAIVTRSLDRPELRQAAEAVLLLKTYELEEHLKLLALSEIDWLLALVEEERSEWASELLYDDEHILKQLHNGRDTKVD